MGRPSVGEETVRAGVSTGLGERGHQLIHPGVRLAAVILRQQERGAAQTNDGRQRDGCGIVDDGVLVAAVA